jgi:NAD+ synthase
MSSPEEEPDFDLDQAVDQVLAFIRKAVDASGSGGVVVGLSGGVDSSLVLALCVRAIGAQKILGLIIPTEFTPAEDLEDTKELASSFGVQTKIVRVDSILDAFVNAIGIEHERPSQRIPLANILARIRMIVLYYFANVHNLIVVGTSDRSEALIGYFTKYGDGGVDILPISHLYKTQVRVLAKHLGVPERIAYKPSSPQLYPGHKATDEIPIGYEKLDIVEGCLFDEHMSAKQVAEDTGVPLDIVAEVVRRFEATRHKREYPAMVKNRQ